MKIVNFMDMHSGGGLKERYSHIYIEAMGEDAASLIFYNRFGHNPNRITCTCCGEDYAINEYDDSIFNTCCYRWCQLNVDKTGTKRL